MTWTAPNVERTEPPEVAGERKALQGWLDYHRATLLFKCQGLTPEQLVTASVPPSNLSLLGLVRHMAEVERSWFRTRFAGEQTGTIWSTDEQPDAEIENVDSATAAQDYATFLREVDLARAVVAERDLDDTYHNIFFDAPMDLRWIF